MEPTSVPDRNETRHYRKRREGKLSQLKSGGKIDLRRKSSSPTQRIEPRNWPCPILDNGHRTRHEGKGVTCANCRVWRSPTNCKYWLENVCKGKQGSGFVGSQPAASPSREQSPLNMSATTPKKKGQEENG